MSSTCIVYILIGHMLWIITKPTEVAFSYGFSTMNTNAEQSAYNLK